MKQEAEHGEDVIAVELKNNMVIMNMRRTPNWMPSLTS